MSILYALAYTLEKLGMDYRNAVSTLDERVILQKTIFLLKQLGYDLKYNFNWYLKGPYSPALASDGYTLRDSLASPVLEDKIESWMQKVENDPEFSERMHLSILPRSESAIIPFKKIRDRLYQITGIKQSEIMEIAASLVYIYEYLGYRTRNAILQFFYEEKTIYRQKSSKVLTIYGILAQHGLIPA